MTAAIPSFIAPAAPQVPSAPPAPAPQQGFARVLSQTQKSQQAAPAPQASDPKPRAAQAEARPASRAPEHPKVEQKAAAKSEKPASKADARRAADDENPQAGVPATHEASEAQEAPEAAAADPSLADWLSGLQLPPATLPAGAAAGVAGQAQGGETLQAAFGGERGGVQGLAGTTTANGPDTGHRADATREGRSPIDLNAANTAAGVAADTAAQAPGWQAALEQAGLGQAELQAEARPAADAHGLGALATASHAAAPNRTGEVSSPAVVSVPTPATAPEFAQSLGVQVSVLARDGVQQAELHLNPAEMGPISVQIALDGTQAQVNFGADSAATRQIIESGLPELAAALRDAGFTLSGGGVHSQARGRGEGGDGTGNEAQAQSGAAPIETDVTTRRTQARVAAGGVDVYA